MCLVTFVPPSLNGMTCRVLLVRLPCQLRVMLLVDDNDMASTDILWQAGLLFAWYVAVYVLMTSLWELL